MKRERRKGGTIDVVKPRNENRRGANIGGRCSSKLLRTPRFPIWSSSSPTLSLFLSLSRCPVNRARYLVRSTTIERALAHRCWKLIAGSIYRSLQNQYWPRIRSSSLPMAPSLVRRIDKRISTQNEQKTFGLKNVPNESFLRSVYLWPCSILNPDKTKQHTRYNSRRRRNFQTTL